MSFCASDKILWPVGLSHNEALPFYAERNFKIESVLTDNGREFSAEVRDTPTEST